MMLGLNEYIRVKFLEHIKVNKDTLPAQQLDALQRYADNPEIMVQLSRQMYEKTLSGPRPYSTDAEIRMIIEEVLKVYA